MGLPTTLFLIFLVLKLTHVIDWSWWLVCLPVIVEVAFDVLVLAVGGAAVASGARHFRSTPSSRRR